MSNLTILKTHDGQLDAEDEAKLAALTARLKTSATKVLLHLHGGLVSEQLGVEIANRLGGAGPLAFHVPADWEQIYVVWRTGAFDTLRDNWLDLANHDKLYRALFRRLLSFLSGKLRVPDGSGRSAAAVVALSPAEIEARLSSGSDSPFLDVDELLASGGPEGRGAIGPDEPDRMIAAELQTVLQNDPAFTAAIEDLDAHLNPGEIGRGGTGGRGDPLAGALSLKRLNLEVSNPIQTLPVEAAGRGVFSSTLLMQKLVRHGAAIGLRVIRRYRTHRDHGFQATIVEELLRELYGDYIGAAVWGKMKAYAADHFAPGGLGAPLIEALTSRTDHRLLLTGHSAGSIWISEMLRAVAARPNPPRMDVVFMAPAVRVGHIADSLATAAHLVGRFRFFAMQDALERSDPVLGKGTGVVYPSSLLYIVSGLFEQNDDQPAVDAPLLGMQRFFPNRDTPSWISEPGETLAHAAILRFLASHVPASSYSKTSAGGGLATQATSHGDFDSEAVTLASVATFF